MGDVPDRIEKKASLAAQLERAWRPLGDAAEFGRWFGVAFDGPFVAGRRLTGRIVPTTVDAEVARTQRPYEGAKFEIVVDRVEPPRLLSFRWHPFAIDPKRDYSGEPMTLVTLELREARAGTELTITETGFSGIPELRRAEAFRANDGGWTAQAGLIAKYLGG